MYTIIWKYKVNKENQVEFEFEYGKVGTWSKLFKNSINYLGSFLLKSSDVAHTYLLIDTWTDEKAYENFKNSNSIVYERLSSAFETLYESEEKMGTFNTIN